MKIDEPIIEDTDQISAAETARALYEADAARVALMARLRTGFRSVAEIMQWSRDARSWADGLFYVDMCLTLKGYLPPQLLFEDDPDRFIATWCEFFQKVCGPVFEATMPLTANTLQPEQRTH